MPRRSRLDGYYKRGAIWWTRHPQTGDRVSTGCKDYDAAVLWRAERERRAADPAYVSARETTVAVGVSRWLAERSAEGCISATIDDYERKLGHFLRVVHETATMGAATSLAAVDARLVHSFITTRLSEDASRAQVKRELAYLGMMLGAAFRRGDFVVDPRRVIPKFKATRVRRERFLTHAEVDALINALQPHRGAWVAFVVATGARMTEANRAERKDVDRRARTVLIRGSKTRRSWRTLPLVRTFDRWLRFAEKNGAGRGAKILQPWASSNLNRDIRLALEGAGFALASANDLRRTHASLLRQRGVPLDTIAFLLGHTSTAMVERVYGKTTVEAVADSLARCDESVPNGTKSRTNARHHKKRSTRKGTGNDE